MIPAEMDREDSRRKRRTCNDCENTVEKLSSPRYERRASDWPLLAADKQGEDLGMRVELWFELVVGASWQLKGTRRDTKRRLGSLLSPMKASA